MRRVFSYPPFVVFFDTLVIVTFTLLVKQDSGVQISLVSAGRLPPGFEVMSDAAANDNTRPTDDVEMFLSCEASPHCGVGFSIKLPLYLVSEIGRFKLLASAANCGKTDVVVDTSGYIERKKTADKNSCLLSHRNIERWVSGRT